MKYSEFLSIVVSELEDLKLEITHNMIKADEVASSDTIKSLEVTETSSGAKLTGRQFFQSVEKGRGPGRVPYNFQAIIANWIKSKGIALRIIPYKRKPSANWHPKYTPEQRAVNSLSYIIARNIRENGTKLFQKGGRTDIYTDPTDKKIKLIKERLQQYFKLEIQRL